jgi:hypothetical protein
VGRIARTAACFCVVLTLDTVATFFGAALRATVFGAAFFAFTADRDLAAVFLAAVGLAAFLAVDLAVVALLALGLEGDFALTARFVLFAAGLAFERDVDRLNPFVRLLLMCGSQKAARLKRAAVESPGAYHRWPSKSTETSICGCFTNRKSSLSFVKYANKEKHLMLIVGLC